jgi:hypothetical protein
VLDFSLRVSNQFFWSFAIETLEFPTNVMAVLVESRVFPFTHDKCYVYHPHIMRKWRTVIYEQVTGETKTKGSYLGSPLEGL